MKVRETAVMDRERASRRRRIRALQTAACPCGQELDVCWRSHCPRCGKTLANS